MIHAIRHMHMISGEWKTLCNVVTVEMLPPFLTLGCVFNTKFLTVSICMLPIMKRCWLRNTYARHSRHRLWFQVIFRILEVCRFLKVQKNSEKKKEKKLQSIRQYLEPISSTKDRKDVLSSSGFWGLLTNCCTLLSVFPRKMGKKENFVFLAVVCQYLGQLFHDCYGQNLVQRISSVRNTSLWFFLML